jgi:transcriptional regulator with XRE-family HTH domain
MAYDTYVSWNVMQENSVHKLQKLRLLLWRKTKEKKPVKSYKDLRRWFGKRLSSAMKEAGISQEKLAGMIGVTPPTISRWEHGHSYPSEEGMISKLAEALGIPIDYFTELSDEAKLNNNHGTQLRSEGPSYKEIAREHREWSKELPALRREVENLRVLEVPRLEHLVISLREKIDSLKETCERKNEENKALREHIQSYQAHVNLLVKVIESLETRRSSQNTGGHNQ